MNRSVRILALSALGCVTLAAATALLTDSGLSVVTGAYASAPVSAQPAPPIPAERTRLAQGQETSVLPVPAAASGPSALNETYQDWYVSCVQQGAGMSCLMMQTQLQQNGQRLLAIEIHPAAEAATTGLLLLPFGLSLASGVALQIDDNEVMQQLSFSTCLPQGCVVPLAFDATALAALRAGTSMKVRTVAEGGGEAILAVSLSGFSAALARLAVLAQ